ncbi:MAG: asparagine synthase-related protein, partial [Gammaproteobacteria bacterium]
FGGVGSALRYVLAKRIQREGIKVILQAEGVDELFAGYANYLPFFLLDAAKDRKFSDFRASLREEDRRTIFKRMRSVSENPFGEYQDGTIFRQPDGTLKDDFKTDMPDIPRPFSSHLINRQFQDLKQLKLPRVLRINDRLSMACGLEFREPFLDHRLVEYAFGLASNAKIKDHSSKYAIRLMMRERLPEAVRLEPKRPVVTPQREWLRDQLRPEVEQLIHDQRFVERGIFDPKHVQTQYKNYVENHSENSFFVWQWINSELWFREFVDL